MNAEMMKKKKLPRGIRRLPDGRLRIYATRRGKPVRLTVTWGLLAELRVRVPPTVLFDFLRTINDNLSTYESNFGSIQRPDSGEVYPPDE